MILEAKGSKPQMDFVNSKAPYPAFIGGYGSGKSHALIMRVLRNLFDPNVRDMAVYMPSYPLIKTIAYPRFAEVFSAIGLSYNINKSDHVIQVNGKQIFCRTLDNPDAIVGYEVSDSFVDELDTLSKEKAEDAWMRVIARNRQKKPTGKNTVCVTTTPEGYKFTYERWGKDPSPSYELIKASTYSNQKNLPTDYIQQLEESYPPKLLQAYLNGEFVNLTAGSVYPDFDRILNGTDRIITEEDTTLHIGMDFNVYNMSAAIHVVDPDGTPSAVSELTEIRDTPEIIEAINDLYPRKRIIVYPDASGRSTKSVDASLSDIKLLKDAGFTVKAPKKNPPIKDRVASFNYMIRDNKGKRRYHVNANACPNLVDSLEKLAYDKNGLPDKSSGFDHMSDAPGYFINMKYPIVRKDFGKAKIVGL